MVEFSTMLLSAHFQNVYLFLLWRIFEFYINNALFSSQFEQSNVTFDIAFKVPIVCDSAEGGLLKFWSTYGSEN